MPQKRKNSPESPAVGIPIAMPEAKTGRQDRSADKGIREKVRRRHESILEFGQSMARHAEQARMLGRMRLQIDRLPLAYILMDAEHRVLDWNAAAESMFGYAKEEALGKVSFELIESTPLAQAKKVIRRIKAGDLHANVVNMSRTKNGHNITCAWFNTPFTNSEGKFAGVISLAQDITERIRADQSLRELAGRFQTLSRRLLDIQEAERRHLARELHDEVGQLLTSLSMLLRPFDEVQSEEGKSKLEEARAIVNKLLDRVRGLSSDLRPAVLDHLGLVPALLELIEKYSKQTGVLVYFMQREVKKRFASEVETTAYRIVQEALTNVARHAAIGSATVRVWATQDQLRVRIEDRGCGFDPEAVLANSQSSGLAGMRERTMLLNGQLTIDSLPGGGTRITADLPLRRQAGKEKK